MTLAKNGATLDLRKKKDPNHCLSGVEASYLHVLGSVRCDNPAFIQLFLDHGIPATICDNRGLSALSLALTRTLIDEGASILKEGIFGLTPLGELFVPGQANQHDDLFSTFKFLLSYRERGIPVFITRQQRKYTVFHTAAAYYRDDELYPRLVDTLFHSFEDRDLLEAPANTPAKSTALQIAIGMYNPIAVNAGMLHTMSLHHLDLVRRISMKRLQPALRMDLEYRVIPYERFTNPAESFVRVNKEVPWCFSLTNNYLQDFQLAAAFEWLLDLIQRDALPEGQLKSMAEVLKRYAFLGKRSDLKIDPDIVRSPYTLLQWYEKAISDDALVLGEKDKAKIQDFMRILRERKEARTQGKFPLPPFDEEFANLHFDHLHPERLDLRKAIASVLLVTRCRCFFDRIGIFSRFAMTRMCQRMTSIDDDVFSQRLSKMRDDAAKEIDKLCKWKSEVGVPERRTSPVSTMKWVFLDEKLNRIESLLTHPEDIEPYQKMTTQSQLPKQSVTVPVTTTANLTFPYKPLDFDKREIRLLTILPESSQMDGTLCCKMGHFLVAPEFYTQEYREYEKSIDKKTVRPSDYHKNWQKRNTAKRFVWGDFSCLSYTWGDPNDTRMIMINGLEVTVRSNLEAALRSFRQ